LKTELHIYVAQRDRGQFEACIPFIGPLSELVEGASPAQLKEELMFKALELIHERSDPAQFDLLLPPESSQLINVWVEVEIEVDGDRPPEVLNGWTHVVAGRRQGSDFVHVWSPRVPGECFAIPSMEDVYEATRAWVEDWARRHNATDLSRISADYPARIERVEVDLGFPDPTDTSEGSDWRSGRSLRPETLEEVATNLTHKAEDGSLPKAFGRQDIVDELVEVLTGTRAAHICLIGPPGTGKTSLIQEAVRQTFELQQAYQQRRDVWQTGGDRIIAGMSIIGQWEQRAERICDELDERGDVLVIDDLLGLVRAGRTYQGDSSVARFIEPYIEQGRFSVLLEATEATYEIARSEAPGFVERFRRVQVPELSHRQTLDVVTELVRALEAQEHVRFTPDAVEAMLRLTGRFFRREVFPGKAVRLVRQCFNEAFRRLSGDHDNEVRVDPQMVANVVRRQSGLPMSLLLPGRGRKPTDVRRAFESRVFAQPDASDVVTDVILAIEQGLSDPQRPLASLLFLGPSGVGKTESAKTLAGELFGTEDRLVRFDMSEFAQPAAATRLIGTRQNPEGELTGRVRMQPFCVLLFDEVEKADRSVLDLLLQVLGDGRLTDAAGRRVDFCNTVVVMTSNLGADSEDRWVGFSGRDGADRSLHYRRAAEQFFRPELFNRFDRVVPFRPLGAETLRRIARRSLEQLLERRGLRENQVMVDVDRHLVEHLVEGAVDRRYGTRTLANRIEQQLIAPLARRLTQDKDRGLTRVTIAPGEGDGLELEVRTLPRAERVRAISDELALFIRGHRRDSIAEAAEILGRKLDFLRDRLDELETAPDVEAIESRYEEALAAFNDYAATGEPPPDELGESLRQCDIFREEFRDLRRRIDGILDPDADGERTLPDLDDLEKPELHRMGEICDELFLSYEWLAAQRRALSSGQTDAATLVLDGLSGNYRDLLADIFGWVRSFARLHDIQCAIASFDGERWTPLGDEQRLEPRTTSVVISSEHPGITEAFRALSGYLWAPVPPSHGRHSLLLLSTHAFGTADKNALAAWIGRDELAASDGEPEIEFVLENGAVFDLQTGAKWTLPEAEGSTQRVVDALLLQRLAVRAGARRDP
jgi:ATP-dependent Clp protease ATP-binding subunit ClpA